MLTILSKLNFWLIKFKTKQVCCQSISLFVQDYDAFDVANEDDELEEFLGIPRKHPKVRISDWHTSYIFANSAYMQIYLANANIAKMRVVKLQ